MTYKHNPKPKVNLLDGLSITYTRSYAHWEHFRQIITPLGARAIHVPLLETDQLAIKTTDRRALDQANYLLFTSENAVNYFFAQGLVIQPSQAIVSIGVKTTLALKNKCSHESIITSPPPYDSEALLAVFTPQHKNIVIIAAPKGRQLLFQQLSQHNHVDFVYVYQRRCCSIPAELIQQSLQNKIMVIASCSSLDCLMENYPHEALKLIQYNTCIAGISVKVANYAQSLGFQHTIHARQASEPALIDAVSHWWSTIKESE